jgi:prepilin-type N-terminal cleavage/methylation domain-containing protein
MTMKQKFSRRAGFSLVEVIVALGIVAFAFVGLLGIIPSGLSSFRQSVDQARALTALNMVASAVRNTRLDAVIYGDANYALPQFFSDSPDAATTDPTKFYVGQPNWGARFFLLEDGTIRLKTQTTRPPKAVLYVIVDSPDGATTNKNNMVAGPLKINAFVVWPYRASLDDSATIPTTRTALAGRIGTRSFLDTVITHYPEPLK